MSQDNRNEIEEPVGAKPGNQPFKEPGDVIARHYEVVSVLGEGGASVVYRAIHKILKTESAIKVLLPDRLPDSRVIQRFQLEAKSIGRLEHKHIVAVHEFGIDDDHQPYLVMDFVDGENLAHLTEANSFLLPKRALALFIQIADALVHAHSRSVIHRDLKPKNVIVEHPGKSDESARLVDFGIAKLLEADTGNKSLTQTGEVFGSPLFMSPEQCKGLTLDHRSDIYSFGCLMFEVITGRSAAAADSVLETLMLHVNGLNLDFASTPPAVILKANAQKKTKDAVSDYRCFNGLSQVIRTCTAPAPESRYQTAEALLKDLHLVSKGQNPVGPEYSEANNAKKIAASASTRSLIIAIAAFTVVTLCVGLFTKLTDEKPQPKTAKDQIMEAKFANLMVDLDTAKQKRETIRKLPLRRHRIDGSNILLQDSLTGKTEQASRFTAGERGAFSGKFNGFRAICSQLTSDQLAKLERLGCTDYSFTEWTLTDEQLSRLAANKKIYWLGLMHTKGYSKAGLAHFQHTSLKKLYLSSSPVDDSWTPILASLPVETLSIRNTRVTDKGLENLTRSKTLKFLFLNNEQTEKTPPALNNRHWRLIPEEDGLFKWWVRQ